MTSRRIVDLTFPIQEGMTTFPVHWHPVVEITQLGRHGIENRETRRIVLGTHTGTHCDAPSHFIPNGASIDSIALDILVGPAVILDLTDCGRGDEVGVARLEGLLGARRPERLVLKFGWSSQFSTLAYYTDHAFLSEDAATWLVENGVKLLAMDTPMPDNPKNARGTPKDSPNHKILLGAGVVLVEYLNNLEALSSPEVELIVLPLKILGADGAPARCIAIENQ